MSDTIEINYLLHIHTLPYDLEIALEEKNTYQLSTAKLYLRVINTELLWRVWLVDEFGELWIEVNSMSNSQPIFETLRIDAGTYAKINTDVYLAHCEK